MANDEIARTEPENPLGQVLGRITRRRRRAALPVETSC